MGKLYKENANKVLNLIITGIPSIPDVESFNVVWKDVLNLIITGIPSILNNKHNSGCKSGSF